MTFVKALWANQISIFAALSAVTGSRFPRIPARIGSRVGAAVDPGAGPGPIDAPILGVFTHVAQELRSQYLLSFSPETLDGKVHKLDVRMSTLPTLFGEKIVIRILDPSSAKLGIEALDARLRGGTVRELLMAVNPTIEGEATMNYLSRRYGAIVPRVSRLARGLPRGADLEYADEVTLGRAFEGRRKLNLG